MNVILLNCDYSYISVVSHRKAMLYLAKGKVTVEKWSDKVIKTASKVIQLPAVLRLVYLVRKLYKKKVAWTRKNVMVRDHFTCLYCGSKNQLTIDHILPKSRGGKDTWENTVTSCKPCNNRKNDKLPSECGMTLSKQPYQPTISEFIKRKLDALGVYEFLKDLGVY